MRPKNGWTAGRSNDGRPSAPVPSVDVGIRPASSIRTLFAALVLLCVAALTAAGCSKESTTEELSTDSADQAADGPIPTAPPEVAGQGSTGSSGDVDVNELILRIDALNTETDICTLLTGQAVKDVTQSNVNLTSLLTNPAGFSQLFAALDRLFAHLVQIGPAELTAPLQTMQGVWSAMSEIEPNAVDAEARASALVSDPNVQAAQTSIGDYVQANCGVGG